ncbi:MAG TPA: DUF192 domain-containing protein [Candidatus Methanoperedens sp.]|nr:DUF192 domain-containing protein [Candidatus Methanoperedens sp.]
MGIFACERRAHLRGAMAALALLLARPAPAADVPATAPLSERRPVCIRGACFDAEIAVSAEERSRGLMFRTSLAPGNGMLFVFPREGRHGFWMKNTLIELDIVFIGADRRVVDVARRAPPCRAEPCPQYFPAAPAAYALEIAGGRAAALGVAAGDLVEFREATPSRPPASDRR